MGNGLNIQSFYKLVLPFVLIFSTYSCGHLPSGTEASSEPAQHAAVDNDAASLPQSEDAVFAQEALSEELAANGDADLPAAPVDEAQENLSAGEYPDDDGGDSAVTAEKEFSETDKVTQSKLDEALDFCEVAQSLWQKGELDSALESLDKAYSLIWEVDTNQDTELIQQKEDLRFLISKRILEIYASRNTVVTGNHDEIPMELNSHVLNEIRLFTGPEKNFFLRSYQRSGQYMPYILQALKEAGLPEDLAWLPLIESGFMAKALSSARALGLWQFIPSTGYKFGLKRNSYIDERIDFMKATNAAIAYLKELHSMFGDWSTVLAAYNCGEGRVLQVIRTQNINYLDNFWDLYTRLPRETARYVPRFIATLHMVKNPEKYGLDQVVFDAPLAFDQIEINRQMHLKDVGKVLNIDLKELEALNPELRYHILPPEPYTLRVPVGEADNLLANLETVPTCTLPQNTFTYARHRVRAGETLSGIARRYRVGVSTILKANNLKSSRIRIGQILKVPGSAYAALDTPEKKATAFSGTHTVVRGDSLWSIAAQYNTTVKSISDLNGLPSTKLVAGQKLKIPGKHSAAVSTSKNKNTYRVQNGDSPYAIALKHNMALDQLLRINKLRPGSTIHPGQTLYLE